MVQFVDTVPTIRRGRPTSPAVLKIRSALSAKPGNWALVEEFDVATKARSFAKQIASDEFEATARQNEKNGYSVYARALTADQISENAALPAK